MQTKGEKHIDKMIKKPNIVYKAKLGTIKQNISMSKKEKTTRLTVRQTHERTT